MKKILMLFMFFLIVIILTGCGKIGEEDVLKKFSELVNKSSSYHLKGVLEIINDDDKYLYDVDTSYEADNKFRVSLKNQINDHEQIILKNEDGVYVLTPSLNKSFKFQSEWPYNNSQAYLLQTILIDIENDKERVFESTEEGYVFTIKANYSNNKNLIKQQIFMDKDFNLSKVLVVDKDENVRIKMEITSFNNNANFDRQHFALETNMNNTQSELTTSTTIEDIIYPMYMPINTYLTSQEKIQLDNGERAILTFAGDHSFMLIQETINISEQYTTELVSGEPYVLSDGVGIVNNYSVNWQSNGIDYYLISDTLTSDELISIANSVNNISVTSITK